MDERLKKKFSIGLNLNENEEDIMQFLIDYQQWLNSLYFSLPLGEGFYSRNELADEYESDGAEEKLFRIIKSLKKYDIRSEVAINIYGLSKEDIGRAITYMKRMNLYPDEIVCLNEYGKQLSEAFPGSELKYSFNNPGPPSVHFDTMVVGKGYIRNMVARHKIIDGGQNLVLLLNNGCSFDCHYPCGDSKFCGSILDNNLKSHDLNYMYALQSFFPSELIRLLDEDDYSSRYRFKLSNRPLGLEFSRRVLDSYCGLVNKSEIDFISEDKCNYGLFCVMFEMFRRRDEFSIEQIIDIKNRLAV